MIRKGFKDNEGQRLAEIFDKILKLKNDGDLDTAEELSLQTLQDYYRLNKQILTEQSAEDFMVSIGEQSLTAEKLDMLTRFLFEYVYPFEELPETDAVLQKAAGVLNLLETEHHLTSLDNINRRIAIEKFLNNRQYE